MQEVRVVTPQEQLIRLMLKVMFYTMVYLPFILAGVFSAIYAVKLTKGGFITGLIFFIIGTGLLYGIVYYVRTLHYKFKLQSNKLWYVFFSLNLLLVSGIPFVAGGGIGIGMFKDSVQNNFEKGIVFLVGGLVLAVPAYIGVLKKGILNKELIQQKTEPVQ
jgi:hypothetical protein